MNKLLYPQATSAPEITSPTLPGIHLSRWDPRIPRSCGFSVRIIGGNDSFAYLSPHPRQRTRLFHIPLFFVEYVVLLRTRLYIYIRQAHAASRTRCCRFTPTRLDVFLINCCTNKPTPTLFARQRDLFADRGTPHPIDGQ